MSDEVTMISYTPKTRSGDLLTIRGKDNAEFMKNVAEFLAGGGQEAANALYEAAQGIPGPVPHGEPAVQPAPEPISQSQTNVYPWQAPQQQNSFTPPWNDAGPPQQLPGSMTPACENCGAPMRYEEWTGKQGKNAGRLFKAWKCPRDNDHKVQWVN